MVVSASLLLSPLVISVFFVLAVLYVLLHLDYSRVLFVLGGPVVEIQGDEMTR